MRKSTSGFTIVELLIVIVVIAILAAISIVAYTGIQQRANNTKTIAAANQVVKAISGYIAANGTYPYTGISCVVPSSLSTCTLGNTTDRATKATLIANLQTISSLPSPSVPSARDIYDGIVYYYSSTREVGGNPQPLIVSYSLNGSQQQCGLGNIITTAQAAEFTTSGYTSSSNGATLCYVSVPGPSS